MEKDAENAGTPAAKIINLINYRQSKSPHIRGHCHCTSCWHSWYGIHPVGTFILECPKCGQMKGTHSEDIQPDVFKLCPICEYQKFYISKTGELICPKCGTTAGYHDQK